MPGRPPQDEGEDRNYGIGWQAGLGQTQDFESRFKTAGRPRSADALTVPGRREAQVPCELTFAIRTARSRDAAQPKRY